MFLLVSVILFTGSVHVLEGLCGAGGVCDKLGCAWQKGITGGNGGHAWQRGYVWQRGGGGAMLGKRGVHDKGRVCVAKGSTCMS